MAMDEPKGGGGSLEIPASWGGGRQSLPMRGSRRRIGVRPRRLSNLSSASALLKGFTFDGKAIQRITKLEGGKRRIVFRGKTHVDVDRATVHELAKWRGTIQYRQKLLDAPTLSAKKAIIRASRGRQLAVLKRHIARLEEGGQVAPAHVRARIERKIAALKRMRFGSPILGETPATSAVPPHHGPAKTFSTIARSGVQFRTFTRHGRHYVVPIVS